MRPPLGPDVVQGFRVTKAVCNCEREIELVEKHIEIGIEAYNACDLPNSTAKDLKECKDRYVAREAKGLPKLKVSGRAAIGPGEVVMTRAEAGSCNPVLQWGVRLWGKPFIEFDRLIAELMGTHFLEEFDRLEGDAERVEKLFSRFPKETERWAEIINNAPTIANLQRQGYKQAKTFFAEVRAVLRRLCGLPEPTEPSMKQPRLERPPFERRRLFRPREEFITEGVKAGEDL